MLFASPLRDLAQFSRLRSHRSHPTVMRFSITPTCGHGIGRQACDMRTEPDGASSDARRIYPVEVHSGFPVA